MFAQKFEATPKLIQHVIAIGSIENLIQAMFAQKFEATPKLIQHVIQAMFAQKFEAVPKSPFKIN